MTALRNTTATGWRLVTRFADLLATVLAVLAGIAVGFIVLGVTYDVVARTLGFPQIRGMVEYGGVLMVAVVFLSIGFAQKQAAHVSVEIFVDRLPDRARSALAGVVLLTLTVGLLWAANETALAAIDSMKRGEIRFGLVSVKAWPARMAIPLGFFSMALQCLVQGVNALAALPSTGRAGSDGQLATIANGG